MASKLRAWKEDKERFQSRKSGTKQANIESMSAYTMQCSQLPSMTNRNIDRISRNFFWKKSNDNKGLPMVS